MNAQLQLILGGARSGKSSMAERRAQEGSTQKIYVATATAGDKEMSARIEHHQTSRDSSWFLHEEPLALAKVLQQISKPETCVVVDCLTLWLSNCLYAQCWDFERKALFDCLGQLQGKVIFVGNEVSMGVIPMGELSREFVDQNGFLHQQLAASCQRVTLCVAGLPLELKQEDK